MRVAIASERWDAVWPEIDGLFARHFAEVDGGAEPKRKYKIDVALMAQMDAVGAVNITTARRGAKLIGYIIWLLMPDVECAGLSIAQMGPWFVTETSPRTAYRLFTASVEALRNAGVQNIYPHHRLHGRGAQLGKFFRRMGAVEIQHTYSLWIGD